MQKKNMKIWFGCTTAQWNKYKKHYFAIRDHIKETGCVLIFDWLDGADKFYNTDYKKRNIQKIYTDVVNAIDEADIIIIEYTVPNFSSSHQINYALLKKKPILVMRLKNDNPRFQDSYLDALQSDLLSIREYNSKNYKPIIDEFIGYSQQEKGQQRYNIVLDKKQKYYLDWATNQYGKSRSHIIRDLIDHEIDQDHDYKLYKK